MYKEMKVQHLNWWSFINSLSIVQAGSGLFFSQFELGKSTS